MQPSSAVRDALTAFYERFSAGEREIFEAGLTADEGAALVIGTDPGQWTAGRAAWVDGWAATVAEMPGLGLEAGEPVAYEDGDLGWAADQPRFVLPDGTPLPVRVTAVMRREDGDWKLVHAHFSIGVPDERLEAVLAWSAG
jgi:ketosteroid isomerase-like protein